MRFNIKLYNKCNTQIIEQAQELNLLKERVEALLEEKRVHKEREQQEKEELLRNRELIKESSLAREKRHKQRIEERKQLAEEMKERGIQRIKNKWKKEGDEAIAAEKRSKKYRKHLRSMTL